MGILIDAILGRACNLGMFQVYFHSDGTVGGRGFNLKYTFQSCDQLVQITDGSFEGDLEVGHNY